MNTTVYKRNKSNGLDGRVLLNDLAMYSAALSLLSLLVLLCQRYSSYPSAKRVPGSWLSGKKSCVAKKINTKFYETRNKSKGLSGRQKRGGSWTKLWIVLLLICSLVVSSTAAAAAAMAPAPAVERGVMRGVAASGPAWMEASGTDAAREVGVPAARMLPTEDEKMPVTSCAALRVENNDVLRKNVIFLEHRDNDLHQVASKILAMCSVGSGATNQNFNQEEGHLRPMESLVVRLWQFISGVSSNQEGRFVSGGSSPTMANAMLGDENVGSLCKALRQIKMVTPNMRGIKRASSSTDAVVPIVNKIPTTSVTCTNTVDHDDAHHVPPLLLQSIGIILQTNLRIDASTADVASSSLLTTTTTTTANDCSQVRKGVIKVMENSSKSPTTNEATRVASSTASSREGRCEKFFFSFLLLLIV